MGSGEAAQRAVSRGGVVIDLDLEAYTVYRIPQEHTSSTLAAPSVFPRCFRDVLSPDPSRVEAAIPKFFPTSSAPQLSSNHIPRNKSAATPSQCQHWSVDWE